MKCYIEYIVKSKGAPGITVVLRSPELETVVKAEAYLYEHGFRFNYEKGWYFCGNTIALVRYCYVRKNEFDSFINKNTGVLYIDL